MLYGWRGKLGLIYPSPGVAGEVEFHRMAPEGVAVMTTRMPLEKVTAEGLEKMGAYTEAAATLLSHAEPDIITFCCTTGSLIKGIGYDRELTRRIETCVNIPALTTSEAVIESLKTLKAERIAVATPYYDDDLNQREKVFLEDNGFEVTCLKSLRPPHPSDTEKPHTRFVHPEEMYHLAKAAYSEDADVVFISCTGLGVIDIIETLERDLKTPVVTSNQATMWAALRKIGIHDSIEGLGHLFGN